MRVRLLAMLLALGGFLPLVVSPAALAAELSAGPSVTVSQGERIDDDLYAAGSTVDIAGEVTRDVFAAASSIVVSGRVGGDATLAAGTIRVDGPIAGSLRVVGGTVEVTAPIGWDLAILGAGSVSVARSATVGHDVAAIGAGTITIDGRVDGDIRGSVGTLIVAGRVNGDIDVDAERIEIRDGAEVRGAFRYRSPQPATIAPGARVLGPQEHTPRPSTTAREPKTALDRAIDWVMTVLLRLSWAIVAGTLLIVLLPRQTSRATDMLRVAPLPTVLWGIAALVVVPIAALLLLVTIVGVPAALLLLGTWLAVLYLSQVLVGIALVRLLPVRLFRGDRRLTLWLSMLVGTTVVLLFRMLPLPFGWTFWWSLMIGVLGLGMAWTAFSGWGLPASISVAGPTSSAPHPLQQAETPPSTGEGAPSTPSESAAERPNEQR